MRGHPKSFGGVPVLKGVTLDLEPGTVTALAGENGAGKSTLMKIVSGQYSADHGTVSVKGNHLAPGNTRDAVKHGVAIVPQELASIEDMTVYENLFVGRELQRRPVPEPARDDRKAAETLAAFDVAISPTARMGSLPVGMRQIVEIVKACSHRRTGGDARRADVGHLRTRGRRAVRASSADCVTTASRWCTPPTRWPRSAPSPTASWCCATAASSSTSPLTRSPTTTSSPR